jgi:hypothetical protein
MYDRAGVQAPKFDKECALVLAYLQHELLTRCFQCFATSVSAATPDILTREFIHAAGLRLGLATTHTWTSSCGWCLVLTGGA